MPRPTPVHWKSTGTASPTAADRTHLELLLPTGARLAVPPRGIMTVPGEEEVGGLVVAVHQRRVRVVGPHAHLRRHPLRHAGQPCGQTLYRWPRHEIGCGGCEGGEEGGPSLGHPVELGGVALRKRPPRAAGRVQPLGRSTQQPHILPCRSRTERLRPTEGRVLRAGVEPLQHQHCPGLGRGRRRAARRRNIAGYRRVPGGARQHRVEQRIDGNCQAARQPDTALAERGRKL
eukprot:scaffold35437_cov101-Isochrysis_galbana.AAC.2